MSIATNERGGNVHLRILHDSQRTIVDSPAKRKVIRAGRRFGKTTVAADIAVEAFCDERRVLYAAPTEDQVGKFWFEVKRALAEPIDDGAIYKNETKHLIALPGTEQRIRAKTAWNADTLRGDYADLLILDEYQLMKRDAWVLVGAPMLLDNDGDAVFIYTTKRGQHHSKELYKKAQQDETGRYAVFNFSSHDNPHLSKDALADIVEDMTALGYRMEILAEEIDDDPAALWSRDIIPHVTDHPKLLRVVVGVDPPGKSDGAECGIVAIGIGMIKGEIHAYVLADRSLQGTPGRWGAEVVATYNHNKADRIVGEINFGGDMVESTIRVADGGESVAYKSVRASRGKAVRAEPIVAFYEKGRVHHVGNFPALEDEMCNWVPESGMLSPNRIDGLVWALTDLLVKKKKKAGPF